MFTRVVADTSTASKELQAASGGVDPESHEARAPGRDVHAKRAGPFGGQLVARRAALMPAGFCGQNFSRRNLLSFRRAAGRLREFTRSRSPLELLPVRLGQVKAASDVDRVQPTFVPPSPCRCIADPDLPRPDTQGNRAVVA